MAADPDLQWVNRALQAYRPPASTAPSADKTAPDGTTSSHVPPPPSMVSVAAMVYERRDAICQLLSNQLSIADRKPVEKFVDGSLIPLVEKLSVIHIQIVYLVLTQPTLKQLVLGGWGHGQFHYNRVADKIIFDGEIDAALDGTSRDSLLPVIYTSEQNPQQRTAVLDEAITRTEKGINSMISRQGQMVIQSAIGEFILSETLAPLHLDHDQDWFDAGVVGVLSARAMALIIDQPAGDLIKVLSQPNRFNPVSSDSIDLAHPLAREQLRPQLVSAYADAFRHRSVAVVADWLANAPDDALPKTIAAIRKQNPTDNQSLLALIHDQTGIDLTPKLSAGN